MYLVDVFVLFSADNLLYDLSFSSYQSQIKHTLSFFPKNERIEQFEYIFIPRLHPSLKCPLEKLGLPSASSFWVDHPADHTLSGLVLLFGERSLGGESSLLLICHNYTEKHYSTKFPTSTSLTNKHLSWGLMINTDECKYIILVHHMFRV